MSIETLITFIGATAILAISPGPDNIYVLVQSLTNGKSRGLATVCGLITGCIVHTTLLAFGVSAIIRDNDHVFMAIKIAGACYLIFLAYKTFKSDDDIVFNTVNTPRKSLKSLFIQGFFMNVLNPKVAIFFLAFFPGFLFSTGISTILQFYILGGIFMFVSFVIFSAIVFIASFIKNHTQKYKSTGLVFKWLQIVVFLGIAIFILI